MSALTELNVFALQEHLIECDGSREFANRVAAVHRSHLRRCIAAGFVEVLDRARLRLTDGGLESVLRHARKDFDRMSHRSDDYGRKRAALLDALIRRLEGK